MENKEKENYPKRIKFIRDKYPKIDIETVCSLDHTPGKKYSLWIAQQLSRGHSVEDIGPTVKLFDSVCKRLPRESRDLYQYEDLKILEDKLKDLGSSKRGLRNLQKGDGHYFGICSDLNNKKYHLYRIDDRESAIAYGVGTRWCITMSNAYYFETYSQSNNLFYFLLGTEQYSQPYDKIAIQVDSYKNPIFWNSADITFDGQAYKEIYNSLIIPDAKGRNTFHFGMSSGAFDPEEGVNIFRKYLNKIISN